MIIGIDDTGNFKDDISYFCSILVSPSHLNILIKKFIQWEKGIRKNFSIEGEIKGSFLPGEILHNFAIEILQNNLLKWIVCIGSPSVNEKEVKQYCEIQRKVAIECIEKGIEFYKKRDSGNSKIANQYTNLSNWYRNLNNESILKITVLGISVTKSINWSIIKSILHSFDHELSKLQLNIDECFLNRQQDILYNWKELLRSILWQNTYRDPMMIPTDWDENHPFIRKFIKASEGNKVFLRPSLYQSLMFCKSYQTPIVRLADILGTLIRKRDFSDTNLEAYKIVRKYLVEEKIYLLDLQTERANIPNPFINYGNNEYPL